MLVVFGHNPLVLQPKGELFNIIFSFHIPLFFFLSGLFFNPDKTFKSTVKDKFDSLLKPYFVTLIAVGVITIMNSGQNFMIYCIKMVYGNGRTIQWAPLWFVTHLFAIACFSWILMNFDVVRIKKSGVRSLLLIVLFLFGVSTIDFFWQIPIELFGRVYTLPGLPFSIDIILITTFFYLLGFFVSKHVLNFTPNLLFVFIALGVFVGCHCFFDKTIDFNMRLYDGYIIPTIEAFCGIYLSVSFSYFISKSARASVFFSTLGASSFIILLFHFIFQVKAFQFATVLMGGRSIIVEIFAFTVGVAAPTMLWFLLKKYDYISVLFMPIKHNRTFSRSN